MSEYCYIFSQNFLEAWYSIRYSLKIYTYFFSHANTILNSFFELFYYY
jgi:hypothetical protein